MSSAVLDASALLALLQDEPGAQVAATALPDACVSAMNLAEVVTKRNEAGVPEPDVRDVVEALALEVVPFEEEAACPTYARGHEARVRRWELRRT